MLWELKRFRFIIFILVALQTGWFSFFHPQLLEVCGPNSDAVENPVSVHNLYPLASWGEVSIAREGLSPGERFERNKPIRIKWGEFKSDLHPFLEISFLVDQLSTEIHRDRQILFQSLRI